jgi:threonine synthase
MTPVHDDDSDILHHHHNLPCQENPRSDDIPQQDWADLSYEDIALKIFSLYISTSEIPTADLKAIIDRSYSTFRAKEVAPLVHLKDDLYLLELFHGPSYSFKDCPCLSCRGCSGVLS